jgi:hypothetical protein
MTKPETYSHTYFFAQLYFDYKSNQSKLAENYASILLAEAKPGVIEIEEPVESSTTTRGNHHHHNHHRIRRVPARHQSSNSPPSSVSWEVDMSDGGLDF